jgi:hypothetical protein
MFTKYEVFYEPLFTDTDSLAYYIKNNPWESVSTVLFKVVSRS